MVTSVFGNAGTVFAVLQSSGDDTLEVLAILLLGFFGGLFLIYDGFRTWQLARLIQDTPTAKVRSMAVGRTELEGVVREHDGTIDVPYTNDPCVYISWEAERRERHTDKDGDVHYTWETVADGTEALWFDLEDHTGRVLVRADLDRPDFVIRDAGHNTTETFYEGERPPAEVKEFIQGFRRRTNEAKSSGETAASGGSSDGLFDRAIDFATDMLDANDPLSNTSKRRRYSQTILPVGTDIYLYGGAEPKQGSRMETSQADLLEIRRDTGTGRFLVSDVGEEKLQNSYSQWGPIKTVGGLVLSAVALYFLLSLFLFPA